MPKGILTDKNSESNPVKAPATEEKISSQSIGQLAACTFFNPDNAFTAYCPQLLVEEGLKVIKEKKGRG